MDLALIRFLKIFSFSNDTGIGKIKSKKVRLYFTFTKLLAKTIYTPSS